MRALDKPSERRERTSNDCHTFLPIETFLSYLLPKCGYVSHLHLCITANALPHFLLKTATLNFYSQRQWSATGKELHRETAEVVSFVNISPILIPCELYQVLSHPRNLLWYTQPV